MLNITSGGQFLEQFNDSHPDSEIFVTAVNLWHELKKLKVFVGGG